MTQLRSHVGSDSYLKQLSQIGVLLQFESFLSCHGDEMGMLEDMAVGVADLHHVSFKLVECDEDNSEAIPRITGNRSVCGYCILLLLQKNSFWFSSNGQIVFLLLSGQLLYVTFASLKRSYLFQCQSKNSFV